MMLSNFKVQSLDVDLGKLVTSRALVPDPRTAEQSRAKLS